MIVLVTGGASSGKSSWAEQMAKDLPGPHYYVATMSPAGVEAQARIARHVAQREGKGFITIELAGADGLPDELRGTLLLEDVGNLIVNDLTAYLDKILAWENAVIVTNDVGSDGFDYGAYTEEFIEDVGAVSRRISLVANAVMEVTAGIPCIVKG